MYKNLDFFFMSIELSGISHKFNSLSSSFYSCSDRKVHRLASSQVLVLVSLAVLLNCFLRIFPMNVIFIFVFTLEKMYVFPISFSLSNVVAALT